MLNAGNGTGKEHETKTSKKEPTKPSLRGEMRQEELKWCGHVMRKEESDPVRQPRGDGEQDKA